jgi:peptidyl-prolyl cis-trans isomerase SurA
MLLFSLAASLVVVCCVAVGSMAQTSGGLDDSKVIDRIAAVVGDRVILASELAQQMQMFFVQSSQRPRNQAQLDSLTEMVLEQMIQDQLLLIAAKGDTSIVVRESDVEAALDEHIARIASQFETNDAFLAALGREGFTLREFKRRYRDEVENQILKQRLVQKKLYDVSVSRHEVEEFYRQFRDSIPVQPEAAKLAHILLKTKASPQIEDSVRARIEELRQRVLEGADFAAISSRHSGLGAAANGGDLGYVSRDDLIPELSRAAFQLNIGDISGVIRSPLGFHVLTCEGKRDGRIKLRHIVLPVAPSAADTARTLELADSLLVEAQSGADFRELAKAYSHDDDTRAQGGELGWFALQDLPKRFRDVVQGWRTPGEFRGPVVSEQGIHVLQLLDYRAESELTLSDSFDQIKEMARQEKTAELIDDWILELKKTTFLDVRLD